MKSKRINTFLTLSIILIFVIITMPTTVLFSKAEETTEIHELQAVLYDTNQYGGGSGTILTEQGATVTNWKHQTSKYLQIDPLVPADGNTYTVSVKLPQQFYIVASQLSTPAGYERVEFTKNESIKINSSTTYSLNKYSGTADYIMKNMGISGTIQLEIGYDVVLWDKQAGTNLTPDGVEPIVVILSMKDSDGNIKEIKRLSLAKATAGIKLSDTLATFATVDNASSSTVYKDKTINVGVTINDNDNTSRDKYYPSGKITVKLPCYTDANGVKHYLVPSTDNIILPKIKYSIIETDSSLAETDGIITINLKDIYFKAGQVFSMTLGPLSKELIDTGLKSFNFTGCKFTLTVDGLNGNQGITYATINMSAINYITEIDEKIVVTKSTPNISIIERPEEAVSTIGTFGLRNTGTGDSCAKTLYNVFNTENTNLIKVTTINTFADTVQQYIPITYTLVDDDGKRVFLDVDGNRVEETAEGAIGEWTYAMKNKLYNSSARPETYNNKFSRSMLPANQRSYYFKTIEYTIAKVPALTTIYQSSAQMSFSSGGNFFGYVNKNATAGQKVICSILVKSENKEIADIKSTLTTTLQGTSIPSYVLDNISLTKTSIQAGESVGLKGNIVMATYPYNNSTWLKGISLGVILPSDISINEQSITAKTASGKNITGFNITSRDAENGAKLWIITFPADICIGYLTEERGTLPNGTSISFNIQLDTAYTMNELTLFAKDIIVLAGYMQTNGAGGGYNWSRQVDTYDLNNNGLTNDIIAKPSTKNTYSCQISAQSATLDIHDSLTVERHGTISVESKEQSLYSADDIINYNLDISCSSGGSAEAFEYYIPIPKKSSAIDNFLISKSKNGNFELQLGGAVSISGNDIFKYTYAFEKGLTYSQATEWLTWYTEEEINNDDSLNWEDVTLIKISSKSPTIENGNSTRTTIKLKYQGDNYNTEAGLSNIWHSGGFYSYKNGDRESAGNLATEGVSIDLKHTMELGDIYLTAAKDMAPEQPGNVNFITVEKTTFPTFINSQKFYITNVETYNVILQTKKYMQANTNLTSTDANKTFAVTIAFEGQTEIDIMSDASATNVAVGEMSANDSPQFVFKLYNADTLTDNSQSRYIVVTLTGDNGLIIKQRIYINREIVQASDPKSAIVEGKRYLIFDDTTTEATISQDSSFTSQFVVTYIPALYNEQRLVFSSNLPIGTKITLANLSDESNPKYFYYVVNSEVTAIKLNQFMMMGKSQDDYYSLPTGESIMEEKILAIVDFSQCLSTNLMRTGNYTIKMELIGINEEIDNFSSEELKFVVKTKRKFSLSHDSTIEIHKEFTVGYSMVESEGNDSKYDGRKLSLVLTAPNSIPADTHLLVNDKTYYLNSNKQLIIPLNDMLKKEDEYTMIILSDMLPNIKNEYKFEISLWVSATANADAPMLGEKAYSSDITVVSNGAGTPSLKVVSMSDRTIATSELTQNHTLTYQYINGTGCYATIELQQKLGIAYQKVTDKLNQVNNTTNHTMGIFNILPTTGTNTVAFKLSSITSVGTYRMVFKIYNSNDKKVIEVPYNFIVKE